MIIKMEQTNIINNNKRIKSVKLSPEYNSLLINISKFVLGCSKEECAEIIIDEWVKNNPPSKFKSQYTKTYSIRTQIDN